MDLSIVLDCIWYQLEQEIKSIKKIIICDSFGYVQYFDLKCRVILSLDYIKGEIDKGTFIDHKLKEITTLVW
jgi:hypothetical protein